jgi:hypothetical protein
VLPAVLLRLELIKALRAGARFDEVWDGALERSVAGAGRGRQNWLEALSETRDTWQRAFERDGGSQRCWGTLEGVRI